MLIGTRWPFRENVSREVRELPETQFLPVSGVISNYNLPKALFRAKLFPDSDFKGLHFYLII